MRFFSGNPPLKCIPKIWNSKFYPWSFLQISYPNHWIYIVWVKIFGKKSPNDIIPFSPCVFFRCFKNKWHLLFKCITFLFGECSHIHEDLSHLVCIILQFVISLYCNEIIASLSQSLLTTKLAFLETSFRISHGTLVSTPSYCRRGDQHYISMLSTHRYAIH